MVEHTYDIRLYTGDGLLSRGTSKSVIYYKWLMPEIPRNEHGVILIGSCSESQFERSLFASTLKICRKLTLAWSTINGTKPIANESTFLTVSIKDLA